MTTAEEVEHVFVKARAKLDEREERYGDSWKRNGQMTCTSEVFRKANSIRVQRERGLSTSAKFQEDLLDLICWSAFAYHLESEDGRD